MGVKQQEGGFLPSKVRNFTENLRTDKDSIYYEMVQKSLQRYVPVFALVTTISLIIFYYITFFNTSDDVDSLTFTNFTSQQGKFYLTLYSVLVSLCVFVLASLDRKNSLRHSFLYMFILSLSVYSLLGGTLYDNPENVYILPIVVLVILVSAVIYPNFWFFLTQIGLGFAVFFAAGVIGVSSLSDGGEGAAVLMILLLVSFFAVMLNRYTYVFVAKMVGETELWLERSEVDSLTGFLNREGFSKAYPLVSGVSLGLDSENGEGNVELNISTKYMRVCEALTKAGGGEAFLYFLDIDGLKRINDVYGHTEGDHVIGALSEAIVENFSPEKFLHVRWGGDEFLILAPEPIPASNIENTLAQWCKERNVGEGKYAVSVTCSEPLPVVGNSMKDVILQSDNNLYSKKNLRKNITEVADVDGVGLV